MKPLLERLAYKLCCTEVKMLLDKIEERGQTLGVGNVPVHRYGLVGIAKEGSFTVGERIALALMFRRHHRINTKSSIVQAIFEGDVKARGESVGEYVPGETLSTRKITEQAMQILAKEMEGHKAIHKSWTDTERQYREQGLL